ncbi:6-phosphofructokinase [Ornithinimicrobium sufpigmenti]|uniref:6-phosphofructokinase n=1 Tax=Ornithinimicrobium sufpigmenti TaxID=2508882 RepID=UPI001EDF06F7|nr:MULTISPECIES: 6-phosphofructokinase [unclassified Ornithinimicrobium]
MTVAAASTSHPPTELGPRVAVLTSGGDSQGMNAAIRAVVRATLRLGGQPYAIHEGWAGAVAGGVAIRALTWDDVGGILHMGGTVLGTARCPEFRTREGMRAAARNLVQHGIDRLVVIGGDGSLRGTEEFRHEWPSLLSELLEQGAITTEQPQAHPVLTVAGLVGSIDNDMAGTDMTIGADTALHRIVDAIDALRSTAASHQRTFVVEVMGRHCGYLALMAAVAGAADAVLVPEDPPGPDWRDALVSRLEASREAGLRDLIVVVAEGATDSEGHRITSGQVGEVITERLGGEGARVTILGHVQRGGRPSAYDRWMPTLLGYAAVQQVLHGTDIPAQVVGVRDNRLVPLPLGSAVEDTTAVKTALEGGDFAAARTARGRSFSALSEVVAELCAPPRVPGRLADPHGTAYPPSPTRAPRRIAVLHAGGVAPGMNTAVRTLVRSASVTGDVVLGVRGSVPGLVAGRVAALDWAEVDDWVGRAGAELGTRRIVPDATQTLQIAETLAREGVDALVLVGGIEAYRTAAVLHGARDAHPALGIPMVCVPAAIDNNLPGAELSIGADTALNTITAALDKLRMSASATQRCFVVETMGGPCGYLAMMSGLAAGAERVYLPEEEIGIVDLAEDAERMTRTFGQGRQLWLAIRGEQANANYSAELMTRIFEEEGGDHFDVRRIALGHVQTGGEPTPYDRLLATRLVRAALAHIDHELTAGAASACYIGEVDGQERITPIDHLAEEMEPTLDRPRSQWWLDLRPVGSVVSDRHATTPVVGVPVVGGS